MKSRVETVLAHVPRGASVLDLGCVQHDAERASDPDWLHKHLYKLTDDVVGIDILADGVADLRERGYDVRVANAETFDLGRQFDCIIAGELIEHLSNFGLMLDQCRDHLEDSGRLIISTPNPWAFCHLRRAVLGGVSVNPEHTCWFDTQTLRQLLKRHGYTDIELYLTPPPHGVTRWIYTLGHRQLGSTHIVTVAKRVS